MIHTNVLTKWRIKINSTNTPSPTMLEHSSVWHITNLQHWSIILFFSCQHSAKYDMFQSLHHQLDAANQLQFECLFVLWIWANKIVSFVFLDFFRLVWGWQRNDDHESVDQRNICTIFFIEEHSIWCSQSLLTPYYYPTEKWCHTISNINVTSSLSRATSRGTDDTSVLPPDEIDLGAWVFKDAVLIFIFSQHCPLAYWMFPKHQQQL
jgi:hypothetical protein